MYNCNIQQARTTATVKTTQDTMYLLRLLLCSTPSMLTGSSPSPILVLHLCIRSRQAPPPPLHTHKRDDARDAIMPNCILHMGPVYSTYTQAHTGQDIIRNLRGGVIRAYPGN